MHPLLSSKISSLYSLRPSRNSEKSWIHRNQPRLMEGHKLNILKKTDSLASLINGYKEMGLSIFKNHSQFLHTTISSMHSFWVSSLILTSSTQLTVSTLWFTQLTITPIYRTTIPWRHLGRNQSWISLKLSLVTSLVLSLCAINLVTVSGCKPWPDGVCSVITLSIISWHSCSTKWVMHSHSSLSSLLSNKIKQTNTMPISHINTEDLSVKYSTSNRLHRHHYHSNSRAILTPLTLTLKMKLQVLKKSQMF